MSEQKEKPDQQPEPIATSEEQPEGGLARIWAQISNLGIAEPVLRVGTHILTVAVVVLLVLFMSNYYLKNVQASNQADLQATAQAIAAPTLNAVAGTDTEQVSLGGIMPAFTQPDSGFFFGIPRLADPETVIPNRARVNVTAYIVELGDSVFSIAEKYGLQPETILWGNYATLQDNPRFLAVGQSLNILPLDGTYHRYSIGENLTDIADFYRADTDKIVEWPGNKLDPYEINIDSPNISDGTWLIIPGGQRALQDWGPPAITRENAASAAYYGAGHCGQIYEGPIGNGIFIWPTSATFLSGYDYDPDVHPALDIAGSEGNAIYATDSGVVVYSGWSDYGYGYLIVIDHGNGWQSAYAHLSGVGVYCGQAVAQGTTIGALGNTGNSSGPSAYRFPGRSCDSRD